MQRRLKFQKFELLQSGSLFAQDAAIIHLAEILKYPMIKIRKKMLFFYKYIYIVKKYWSMGDKNSQEIIFVSKQRILQIDIEICGCKNST